MVGLGIKLDDSFLKEEERDGYKVTADMKKVWAVELDLLSSYANVCAKYGLRWWADGGTLLGAVRHNGFIPWDDDIDVIMPREDYDLFLKLSSLGDDFKEPYHLQTDWNEVVVFRTAKLRRSDTAAIVISDAPARYEYNQGIFIDIFPMDKIPENTYEFQRFSRYLVMLKEEMSVKFSRWWLYERGNNVLLSEIEDLRDRYEIARRTYNGTKSRVAANLSLPRMDGRTVKILDDFADTLSVRFENMILPIPKGYGNELTCSYGNWREPMMNMQKHGNTHFDTDRTYKGNGFYEGYGQGENRSCTDPFVIRGRDAK